MPKRTRQHAAPVASIYRPGDRVLVDYFPGFYEVIIQRSEIKRDGLWLYGVAGAVALSFPARQVAARLAPGEKLDWHGRRPARGGKEVR